MECFYGVSIHLTISAPHVITDFAIQIAMMLYTHLFLRTNVQQEHERY